MGLAQLTDGTARSPRLGFGIAADAFTTGAADAAEAMVLRPAAGRAVPDRPFSVL